MQKTIDPKEFISELSKTNDEPGWLLEKRQNALSLFNQLPMPSFVYGLNINLKIDLNLSDLDITKSKKIQKEIISNNKDVKVYNLNEALEKVPRVTKRKLTWRK